MRPLLALVAVTAVWGVTFVQVKDAVEIYPILPFLAVRFGIASAVLAPAAPRVRGLGRRGAAGAAPPGALLGARYALPTLGLARARVPGARLLTGLDVVASPLAAIPAAAVPRGWTVWGALVVTGVFASALGFLVQTWAQQRTSATRTALVFTLEPVWAALFGYTLAGDRLGALGWGGCAVIMAGIVLAEPAAAATLVRLVRRPSPA